MAVAFVYSILAVLVMTIVSTTSFPSNIHESMTRAERSAVFGSEDSVPEYEVFPMSLSRMRRSVKNHKIIKLKLKLEGKIIILKLKPTAGYLATKYIPVWSANSDSHAARHIRYDPLPKAMSDIGKFKMYHDIKNEAAITVYTDPTDKIVMEGVVTPYYGIKSLPKRLMKKTLKVGDYVAKIPIAQKRSIITDPEEDTGYFVLVKVPDAPENATRFFVHGDDLHREKRSKDREDKRIVPKVVYPEILIVLDHIAMRNRTITQALRFMLALWNTVDLVYSSLDEPEVHFSIAGIIIFADDFATRYISNHTVLTEWYNINKEMTLTIGNYFYNETVRLHMNRYDMIVVMTTASLSWKNTASSRVISGVAIGPACGPMIYTENLTETQRKDSERTKASAFVHYNWDFGGVNAAVKGIAHLFNVKHDEGKGETADCDEREYVMSPHWESRQPFKWSNCSRNFLKTFFSSVRSKCLVNKPKWSKPVKKILPGSWLSMNGQCQNYGYEKSCELKKSSICVELGCQNGRSKCVRQRRVPLPGSRCGHNKYCNSKKKCVHDDL